MSNRSCSDYCQVCNSRADEVLSSIFSHTRLRRWLPSWRQARGGLWWAIRQQTRRLQLQRRSGFPHCPALARPRHRFCLGAGRHFAMTQSGDAEGFPCWPVGKRCASCISGSLCCMALTARRQGHFSSACFCFFDARRDKCWIYRPCFRVGGISLSGMHVDIPRGSSLKLCTRLDTVTCDQAMVLAECDP